MTCYKCNQQGHYANKCPDGDAGTFTKNLNKHDKKTRVVNALKKVLRDQNLDVEQLEETEFQEILSTLQAD